jgi:predicted RND superfamily exporter protein
MPQSSEALSRRYVAWLRRHVVAVIVGHVAALGLAGYLIAYKLPLYADFSYLLPQDAPAVVDLRRLEARVKATETMLYVVEAPTPEVRAAVVTELAAKLRALPKHLVTGVEDDDAEIRGFLRDHRFLFVSLDDLQKARDALAERIKAAKLHANPLYVDLDDDHATDAAAQKQLDDLRAKRRDAEARLDRSSHVSKDGKVAMLEVGIAFHTTDIDRGKELIGYLEKMRRELMAAHPAVVMGYTGSIVTAVSEHSAIFNGIVMSSIVTALLVGLVLALYFRSATLLVLLVSTIAVATAAAFGAAALTVGHLNAATAFLGAIIAGNGVNYGILLIARYQEERRRIEIREANGVSRSSGTDTVDESLAQAILHTMRPTAVASLGASIAYGSLAATSFKGFADFAVIGAIGMLLCWIASYVLLPALMIAVGGNPRTYHTEPFVGRVLVRLIGFRDSRAVVMFSALLAIAAAVVVVRYIVADPFEYDIKQLRSEGKDATESRRWMKTSDDNFGRGYAGRTFIAADRASQVPQIVAALLATNKDKDHLVVGSVTSILDAVPADQDKKLAVLAQIRTLLDSPDLDALDDKQRAELEELKPPADLKPITFDQLPPSIKDKPEVTEADGRVGLMISIHSANGVDEWNGHDLIRFSNAVRSLRLSDGETVTTSGSSVIFADIIDAIESDGPRVTLVAAIGLIVMVLLTVGRNRRAVAVLIATVAGSLLMVAICALLSLKVNFLDFVALPITLGLGIDYAINVAHRQETDAVNDPIATLRTSGSAVFVCSLTTMIGYGSLLVSQNLAIRGFGAASLIGEVTCVLTALVLVPALLVVGQRRKPPPLAIARETKAA